MWSLGWVIIIRLILYLVIAGFFLQYIYFGEQGRLIFQPSSAIAALAVSFFVSLFILAVGVGTRYVDQLIALTYIIDLMVLTRIILVSGGFNSVFVPYYLPVLVMAPAWLPRRYTAIFPSIATLGAAYIGLAHLLYSLDEGYLFAKFYPSQVLWALSQSLPHTIVSNMLILAVLYFVVSYLSGIISDRLFLEQRLNSEIITTMQEGVAVVNRSRQIVFSNPEFVHLFPAAARSNDFVPIGDELLDLEEGGFVLENLLPRLEDGPLSFTREGDAQKGRPPVEVRITGITLRGKSEVFGLVFLVSDLSLRRRMEAAERNVERFSATSAMAAGLAHEIRNPLASLRSAIQEIGGSFPEGSENRILSGIVIAESDRLDRIIGRFLDFSREGELRLTRRTLGGMLEGIAKLVTQGKDPSAFCVDAWIRSDPEVVCDSDRIKEVFLNLALNAQQASPAAGGKLDIVLSRANRGMTPGMEILFMDNGHGMSDDDLRHMFEPFYSNKVGGTGMGLALCRKQVSMHGGDITAENRHGGGATFRVWLPLAAEGSDKHYGSAR